MVETTSSNKAKLLIGALHWPLLIWAIANACAGFVGIFVYAGITSSFGPVYVMNPYIGMWLCIMLFFFSVQGIYHEMKPNESKFKSVFLVSNVVYFVVIFIESFIMFLGYTIAGYRSDAIIWTILLWIICLLNVCIVVLRWFGSLLSINTKKSFIIHAIDEQHGGNTTILSGEQSNSAAKRAGQVICISGIVLNTVLRGLFIILMALLVSGAINAALIVNYPPQGKFITIPLADGSGRSQTIHYKCEGPVSLSSPVFLVEGDFSHGYADYVGIQKVLTSLNRRSCIYDKPGLGYSDYLFVDQKNESTFYHNFLTGIGETKPYVMVGWGGGGPMIYRYALEHPEMVKSLVFLDVFPNGIEFISVRDLKNMTQAEYEAYRKRDITGRKTLINIINALGVPWGLMSIFVPSNSMSVNAQEIATWMRTEKTWITQTSMMDTIGIPDTLFQNVLPSNISVNLVISKHNDSWVERTNYQCKQHGVNSEQCQFQKELNTYYFNAQNTLVSNRNGGTITYCTSDDCNLGYYVFTNPNYTASLIHSLYPM